MTTTETTTVQLLRWQVDRLGYMLCGDCADVSRGGNVDEREVRDILRSAETDDADMWTCGRCHRYITAWPVVARDVRITVDHVPCRIF